MIGPVSSLYQPIGIYASGGMAAAGATQAVSRVSNIDTNGLHKPFVSETKPSECQTCSNRKYVDASNDSNVSFQTPTHVSPQSSHAMVSAHEQEHVTNAYNTASLNGGKVVYASVSLKMSVCSECHTPYVAGGVTRSQIKYNTSNPYENNRKSLEGSFLKGMNVNYAV